MSDDSEMLAHLARAFWRLPDDVRAKLEATVRDIARERIVESDRYGVPLEMALALHGGICGEIWVEIKRREAGRKS